MKNLLTHERRARTHFEKLKMKLSFVFLLSALFSMQANESSAQNPKVTLNKKNVPVSQIIDEIENQSEYHFIYRNQNVDINRNVTIRAKQTPIRKILELVFGNTNTAFIIVEKDKLIHLTAKEYKPSAESDVEKASFQYQLKGSVLDENANPLAGASVVEKGTKNGVTTDFDGNFIISLTDGFASLEVSYLGYITKEIPINGATEINISLQPNIGELNEVVVIGYGQVKKNDVTGAVGVVDDETLRQLPIVSTEQGLQGRIPGVQISQSSGAPGGAFRVRIRGNNSVQFGNEPLYVIDGFPLDSSYETGNILGDSNFGANQGTSPLAFINPNDIESISVLKDASATAIYGARGANGVVLITTKKGKVGKTRITFDHYSGLQQVSRKLELLNSGEWASAARTFWERFRSGSLLSRAYSLEQIEEFSTNGVNTDWQDEVFRTALISNYNLSISGGAENTKFLVSGNYLTQEGVVIESKFQKGSLRLNLEHDISDRVKFGTNITASYIQDNAIPHSNQGINDSGVVHATMKSIPNLPVKNPDGSYTSHRELSEMTGVFARPAIPNPVELAKKIDYKKTNNRTLANGYLEYSPSSNFKLKTTIGVDISNIRLNTFLPSDTELGRSTNGTASISTNRIINWVNENTISYQKSFNNKHNLNIVGGISVQKQVEDGVSAVTQDFFSNVTGYNNLSSGNNPQPPNSFSQEWALNSYLGRVNYDYEGKYFITASARYDGSSRFGPENKYGFFPSAALAWRISKENLFKDSNFLNNWKVRLSYGRTGNQEIPLYQSIDTYTSGGQYAFGNQIINSIEPGLLSNPDIKWETTNQYNIGMDLGFFRDRLSLTADYYYKETSDLLLPVPVARQGGFSTSIQNIGKVENKGLELSLNGVLVDTSDFKWNLSANFSLNRNKVLELADSDRFFGPRLSGLIARNGGAGTIIKEGEPLGVFWGNIFDGLWQTQEEFDAGHMSGNGNSGPGFENLRDIDGNGIFEEGLDETVVGNPNPDYEFGINTDLSYKNLSLSFFIYSQQGNDILNLNRIGMGSQQVITGNAFRSDVIGAWDGAGTSNTIPIIDRPAGRSGDFPSRVTSQIIEDGSFIKLKNVTLGYNVPLKDSFFSRAKIYISGENILIITNYEGFDPEVNSFGGSNNALGIDLNAYPASKTIRLGLQLEF